MRLIKKLDSYVLKAFLQLFAGTFFISLFVFLMQFAWRYVDDLVGKGLSTEVLMKFFFYAALTLVPMALPLSLLLASLITFGNFGERLELLSMKAAGIPLLRILRPVFLFVLLLCGGSFYFQNVIGPNSTQELARLLWSMRTKSPELEIPEGTFYSNIPGYNLFVEHKDADTGMLYGVMIYIMESYDDVVITLADSAKLQSTKNKKHLKLTLYSGERFRNMNAQTAGTMQAEAPYMRETFVTETDYIAFADSFNLMDASLFAGNAATKDLVSIRRGIDSLTTQVDSMAKQIYSATHFAYMQRELTPGRKDSASLVAHTAKANVPLDTLYERLDEEQRKEMVTGALTKLTPLEREYEFRKMTTEGYNQDLRTHWVELFKKFTLSVACLVFFLIGAPLGAIIRKGGLGMPVVISVVIFIFYYILNNSGEKMAKNGSWPIVLGVWLSTFVLMPIGLWLTSKANKDSVVFNMEGYRMFFQRVFGLRSKRRLNRKEVIINDPDYETMGERLKDLVGDCEAYMAEAHLMRMPNYRRLFFEYREDDTVIGISERLEALVEELHNTRDNAILTYINEFPVLVPDAHTRPFRNAKWNKYTGLLLPLGLFFFLRIWRYRLRLLRDLMTIKKTAERIAERVEVSGS